MEAVWDGVETLEWMVTRLLQLHVLDPQHYVEPSPLFDFPMAATTLLMSFTALSLTRPTVGTALGWLCGLPGRRTTAAPGSSGDGGVPPPQLPRDAFSAVLCALAVRATVLWLSLAALAPLCIALCGEGDAECTPSSVALGLLSATDCGVNGEQTGDRPTDDQARHRLEPAFAAVKEMALASWWSCRQPGSCASELLSPWPLVNVPVRLQALFFWWVSTSPPPSPASQFCVPWLSPSPTARRLITYRAMQASWHNFRATSVDHVTRAAFRLEITGPAQLGATVVASWQLLCGRLEAHDGLPTVARLQQHHLAFCEAGSFGGAPSDGCRTTEPSCSICGGLQFYNSSS
jgi:hypothetical protein